MSLAVKRRIAADRVRLLGAWNRFWFAPQAVSTLALFRILYGSVVAVWALALLTDARAFLGPTGVLPKHPSIRPLREGLLDWLTSDTAAVGVVCALVIAGVVLALGFRTRLVSIVVFFLLLSIFRRNPHIVNSGDSLLRHYGFFLMLSPAGEALSLDRWLRAREDFWSVPQRAPWALRMIQIQVSVVYFFSTFAKVQSDEWVGGRALAMVWRSGDLVRFDVPLFLYDSMLVSNLATYATIIVEFSLATLIWNRALRPYVIVSGLLLHAGIESTMTVGFFNIAACVGYLAFLSPERGRDVIAWVRKALTAAPIRRARLLAAAGGTPVPGTARGAHSRQEVGRR